jgi:hypothetical protein
MTLGSASLAGAQSSEFSEAILSLPSQLASDSRLYDAVRLFGGRIDAVIRDRTGQPDDFEGADVISFQIVPRSGDAPPTGVGFTAPFVGTRAEFEEWARANAEPLLAVLFPAGLSAGATGRDVASFYSQQFLLTTILDVNEAQPRSRFGVGGLLESEWLSNDVSTPDDSAWGLQGLYGFSRTLSVQARIGRQQEAVRTTAVNAAVDYHPFLERGVTTRFRVGGSARGGFVYSKTRSRLEGNTNEIQLGTVDFAGGGWASVRRRFSNVTIGGGGMFQGMTSWAAGGEEGTFGGAFADAINDRGVLYDVTLGATARVEATTTLSVIGRFVQTYPLESSIDRPVTHLLGGGVMFALAPGASVDVGYKWTSFGDVLAQSVYFQGNFGW